MTRVGSRPGALLHRAAAGARLGATARRIAVLMLLAVTAHAQDVPLPASPGAGEAEQKLARVREQIRELAEAQTQLQSEKQTVMVQLRDADRAIAAANAELRTLAEALDAHAAELQALEAERDRVAARLQTQRDVLAAMLRSAYALGRHEQLKLLLAQDSVEQLQRTMTYHRYLQRDRVARIGTLLDELRGLAAAQQAVDAQQAALQAARAERDAAVQALQAQRAEREQLMAQLDARFQDGSERLKALGRDETGLMRLLESLRDIFADIPDQLDGALPLAQQRGRLPRPVQGRVLSAFGGSLPDGAGSRGWLIAADAGTDVRAIAHGRVAFADWIKGYGLLVIVDHGEGYMSLYAMNDTLLRVAGDWVARGDVLATVGSSGGQPVPALYFELRKNGTPIDPQPWMAR